MAGIKTDPEKPGFKHIIMNPSLTNHLNNAKATYHSIYGDIVSDWKKDDKTFSWNITIPVNTTATIAIPAVSSNQVKEGGKNSTEVKGVKFIKIADGKAMYEIESGNYSFSSVILKR